MPSADRTAARSVHPEWLERRRLPPELTGKKLWDHRLQAIADLERYLARQGTIILKFFLNISKEEQRKRFLARLDEPHKNWKFSAADWRERAFWNDYQTAFEQAIAATAAPHAPGFVIPADHKWIAHLIVGVAIIEALETLDLKYPELSADDHAKLQEARQQLENEA